MKTLSALRDGVGTKTAPSMFMALLDAPSTLRKDAVDPTFWERRLRSEADGLLRERVGEAFGEFGEVEFVGSYALHLMTSRDLNICIRSGTSLDRSRAFELGACLVTRLTPSSMVYRDTLNACSPGMPRGLGWSIHLERRQNRTWTLGIWLVDNDAFGVAREHTARLLSRISPNDRLVILKLKAKVCRHPGYRHRFNSEDVYRAVLDHGVTSLSALRRCLRRRGVRL